MLCEMLCETLCEMLCETLCEMLWILNKLANENGSMKVSMSKNGRKVKLEAWAER